MILQILACMACILAVIFQSAVYRSPICPDSEHTRVARMITILALVVAAIALLDALLHHEVHPVQCLIFGLFALGQILFAMPQILKEVPSWKSHWNSSP